KGSFKTNQMKKRFLNSLHIRYLLFVGILLYSFPGQSFTLDPRLVEISSNQQSISGSVKKPNGDPIVGVTIQPKSNPSAGTTTDSQGYFTISISAENEILIFRSIGYQTKELPAQTEPMEVTLLPTEDRSEER